MADIKWIKLSVEMFDDEKIKLIRSMPEGNAILVVWIQLLSLAGKTNDSGMIYISRHMAYSEEMLSTIFNHPLNVIRLALRTLESFGLIEVNPEGVINITNWEKHQNIEGMERVRKLNAERNKKYRERKKQEELPEPKNDVSVTSHDGTDIELDIDKEEDKEIKKETKKKPSKHKHGEFKNVLLTEDELNKLKEKFPHDLKERIEKLSFYIESKGASYKNHYATILSWARRDEQQKQPEKKYDYF